jgi:hypothetical protein
VNGYRQGGKLYYLLFSTSNANYLFQAPSEARNIFDNLPDLAPAALEFRDELKRFLATAVEDVKDALKWWFDRQASFPRLSRMARDYLSIPGKQTIKSLFPLLITELSNNCWC